MRHASQMTQYAAIAVRYAAAIAFIIMDQPTMNFNGEVVNNSNLTSL